MDLPQAHITTLWCAILAKAERGLLRLVPDGLTLNQIRTLSQLATSNDAAQSAAYLSWALSMKPADVEACLCTIEGLQLATRSKRDQQGDDRNHEEKTPSNEKIWEATERGRDCASKFLQDVAEYSRMCESELSDEDRIVFADMTVRSLAKPGGFFARDTLKSRHEVVGHPIYFMTSLLTMHSAITSVVKATMSLSFTDFRFLLELYPKRRGVQKTMRARHVTSYLRTGRSYVSTTSLRLEGAGLIERIPDPEDARGILFALTPKGSMLVQETGDDVFSVFVAQFGGGAYNREFLRVLKRLLIGLDQALDLPLPTSEEETW